jgi:probable HAF family extracellular repeat protein
MRPSSITRVPILLSTALALVLAAPSAAIAAPPARTAAPPARTAALPAGIAAPLATTYRMVDLGTLGGESSYATAMNDRGWVVGRSQVADGTWHGFLWRRGRMTDLGTLSPSDINNRGQIVGLRDDLPGAHLWTAGRLVDLGSLGGDFTYPTAINDRGQIVGMSGTAERPDVPFLWAHGVMRELPLNTVSDIDNRGRVSGGRAAGVGGFHASVWRRGVVTDLGAAAFDRSNTYRINDKGWVIGWTFSPERDVRGTLWRGGTTTDVGTLGGNRTHLVAINDRGVILGVSTTSGGADHPARWHRGVLTDLTTAGIGPDDTMVDLNNRGEIAASIRPVWGVSHAVVYRPGTSPS